MACKKYTYAAGDTAWVTTFMEAVEKSWKGLINVTLTNYTTTAACSIEEGSVLEVAGSLYIATSDTAIGTAGISTALQYIQAIGSTGGCVFAYNAVAPTWRDDYQGYYASAASTTRIIGGCYYDGSSYNPKWIYKGYIQNAYFGGSVTGEIIKTKILSIGDWDMDATEYAYILHGLPDTSKIINTTAIIRNDSGSQVEMLQPCETGGTASQTAYVYWITSTTVLLQRGSASEYNSSSWDSTGFNRGWVTIYYMP